jgi:S-layer homology domain
MLSRLVLLFILVSLTACGNNIQQALAPDPLLLPSPTPTPLSEPVVSPSPETPPANIPSSPTSPESTVVISSPSSNTNNANKKYLRELSELEVLSPTESQQPLDSIVSRRAYARWLLAAHNKIYQASPNQQLKLATADTPPSFTDVPANHPDFIAIQSLANAGIIPSTLSGSISSSTFQPDVPLTREELILWKVPLDSRQALPSASVAVVQKNWGFQDTAKISPAMLSSVLADYQNGDKSNIRRAFGYTTLFQPQKPVTLAETLSTIWYFGTNDGRSAHDAIINTSSPSPSP